MKSTPNNTDNPPSTEMGFFDHLNELRNRIIWSVISIAIGSAVSGFFIDFIMNQILLKPSVDVGLVLQNLRPFGQPFLYFKTVLICGIILAVPMILYQLWLFIAPGLYEAEKRWVGKITFFTSFCFFAGVAFSYFVMIPSMLSFAQSFGSDAIKNNIDINEYFSFLIMILLAAGIMFEMPMIAFVLTKFGLITSKTLRKFRRHSIVVILVLAAILTPTPDPISQLIFAAPLFILYEISILVSKFSKPKEIISDNSTV